MPAIRTAFSQWISLPAAGLMAIFLMQSPGATGAETNQADDETIEEVVVYGLRQIIQNSIEIKRDEVSILDGLSAEDIGDLPALSIGEAMETITGASSHRENGGATEISIRGLGPFLSATTFNGREATNGSGDRSVNFSQFPSELMNRLLIYKTQNARLIEGGVAGLMQLETLKPLDYGKSRMQINFKGNYNPDQKNIRGATEGDFGYRGTFSYVDQFQTDSIGGFGISLGYQKSDTSQPEAEVRSSSPSGSSRYACINDPEVTNEGFYRSSTGDCEDQVGGSSNQGYQTSIDPATGLAESAGLDFAFAPSSRGYRQNDTSEERDAFFGAFQWQPTDRWDINLDFQISDRTQAERRHDLNFANQKRATVGVTGPALVTSSRGAILEWAGETAIESNSELYRRTEEYIGGGLSAAWSLTPRLTLSADASFSETTREELQVSLRLQSDNQDIFNESTAAGYRPDVTWERNGEGIPHYVIQDFDVTDHSLFSDEYRVRIDSDVDRRNTIQALRVDVEYDLDLGIFTTLETGGRWSELEYLNLGGTRYTSPNLDDSSEAERTAIAAMNQACRNNNFPESSFLNSVRSGDLITVIDSASGQETSGTGNSWATFNTRCITNAILEYHGVDFRYPDQFRVSPSTTDVTEETLAAYVMVNFDTSLGRYPLRGNFGVRIVETDVKSVAYRTEYEIVTDGGGFLSMRAVPGADLERVASGGSYTEFLPSASVVLDLDNGLLLRGGIYRGLSRVDPSDMGYNRSFSLNGADDITDPNDLITNVSGSGNPEADPLLSWNYDAAVEWYPNDDTMVAIGLYYKSFTGGFEQSRTTETFRVDGQPVEAEFTITETLDDENDLYGMEVTGVHRFSYLPGLLSGLGFKLSYNYANSDFEFEDSLYGSVTVRRADGSIFSQTDGILAPGNVPGYSEQVFAGQLYWQAGDFDTQIIYKHRSDYFQPYVSNGTRLRYVGDVDVWEARLSYRPTRRVKITLEGINLFDEPKTQYFFTTDTVGEVNVYGPRYFLGVQVKL